MENPIYLRGWLSLLAAICLILASSVLTVTARATHAASAVAGYPQRAKFLVLIVLDGARPDYFGLTPLPNVDALRASGVQYSYAIDGILEAETPAGHTTLATGSTPRRNGILGFNWAQNDRDYSLFSPDVVRSGAIEHIMESTHVPTIAGLYKAKHPRAKVVALSGHKYYAADPLGGPQADAIMYYRGDSQRHYAPIAIPGHEPPPQVLSAPGLVSPTMHLPGGQDDTLATRLALSAFAVMRPRILMINYPEFDWPLGHVDGGNTAPRQVVFMMRRFDTDFGMIEDAYRKAGIFDKTLFVITADHGMVPVRRFIPRAVITRAVAKAGTKTPAITNNGASYIWLKNPRKAPDVALNLLKENDPGIQSVYYLTTSRGVPYYVRAGGSLVNPMVDAANRYLLGTLINGHEPTLVAFARTNQSFSPASAHWKADHGGGSWPSQHIPLILAGPGIRAGVVTGEPAQLDDVAPTVLADMGVTTAGMEGHVLADALRHPGSADWAPRNAEAAQLTPLIRALIAQRDYEVAH